MEYGGVQKDESAAWKAEGQFVFSLSNEVAGELIVFQCEVFFVRLRSEERELSCFVLRWKTVLSKHKIVLFSL